MARISTVNDGKLPTNINHFGSLRHLKGWFDGGQGCALYQCQKNTDVNPRTQRRKVLTESSVYFDNFPAATILNVTVVALLQYDE